MAIKKLINLTIIFAITWVTGYIGGALTAYFLLRGL
jgi:hypothetical protein